MASCSAGTPNRQRRVGTGGEHRSANGWGGCGLADDQFGGHWFWWDASVLIRGWGWGEPGEAPQPTGLPAPSAVVPGRAHTPVTS